MTVTAWKGGTYGIRVGLVNAHQYFKPQWSTIDVRIEGRWRTFPLTKTFWTTCPEFRGGPIPAWLKKRRLVPWPLGRPPRFTLAPLGRNRFDLR